MIINDIKIKEKINLPMIARILPMAGIYVGKNRSVYSSVMHSVNRSQMIPIQIYISVGKA
mgnify:CR=1